MLRNLLHGAEEPHVIDGILRALGQVGTNEDGDALLPWTRHSNDFHRLAAVAAMARIGDDRVVHAAVHMVNEERPPVRRADHGVRTHARTIADLTREALRTSSNAAIRGVAERPL